MPKNKKSKYPRIGSRTMHVRKNARCDICERRPAGHVDVQVNWFRGDDGVHPVCRECQRTFSNYGLLRRLEYIEAKVDR